MSRSLRALLSTLTLVALAGCFYEPCDDYVDYLCTCHEDDPQYSCEELSNTYLDAEPDIQDQCAISLSDVQQEDDEAGLECEW